MDNQMNQYDNGGGHNNGGNGNAPGGNGSGGGQPPQKPNLIIILLGGLVSVLLICMLWNMLFGANGGAQEVSYTKFLEHLSKDELESVEVQSNG